MWIKSSRRYMPLNLFSKYDISPFTFSCTPNHSSATSVKPPLEESPTLSATKGKKVSHQSCKMSNLLQGENAMITIKIVWFLWPFFTWMYPDTIRDIRNILRHCLSALNHILPFAGFTGVNDLSFVTCVVADFQSSPVFWLTRSRVILREANPGSVTSASTDLSAKVNWRSTEG